MLDICWILFKGFSYFVMLIVGLGVFTLFIGGLEKIIKGEDADD